jgi:hypothetical protein
LKSENGGLLKAGSGDRKLTCFVFCCGKSGNVGGNSMKRESFFGKEMSAKPDISAISGKKDIIKMK